MGVLIGKIEIWAYLELKKENQNLYNFVNKFKDMTTISFEIEQSEISRLSAILKAYGVKKLKIVEDYPEMTKEDFTKKIERARKSPGKRVSIADQSKMLGL